MYAINGSGVILWTAAALLASDDAWDAVSLLPVEAAAAAPTPPVHDQGVISRAGVTGKDLSSSGSRLKGQARISVQGVSPCLGIE